MVELQDPQFDKHGYIQVYTGNGKGKTTAALGLALRAIGHSWNVVMFQFAKAETAWHYGEVTSLLKYPEKIQIRQYGKNRIGKFDESDIAQIQLGWSIARSCIIDPFPIDMIVLDELNYCIAHNIINIEDVLCALKNKPEKLEVVVTGRDAHPKLLEIANLVSEILPVKHYFTEGVLAREGIEW